jgi:hypothetical protein
LFDSIIQRKRRHPNAPGTSRRQHYDRPNSKKRREDFIWHAPNPRYNSENQVRLTIAGQTEFAVAIPQSEIEARRRSRESMQIHKEELLKDDRIKPTAVLPMQEGARGSHEEGRSPGLQEQEQSDSGSEELPLLPAVTPEARQAIRTLEIIAAERHALEDKEKQKEEKNQAFIQKHVFQPAPQNWAHHHRCALRSRHERPIC